MSASMMQKINSFALRSFRDTADRDYVHARMAYRSDLFPQFFWSSLHALEKYAKCILILNRIPKPQNNIKHEVLRSLELLEEKICICLSDQSINFLKKLEEGARFRYLEVSWYIKDCELAFIDRAVWELRRYCNSALYIYKDREDVTIDNSYYARIKSIDKPDQNNSFIQGGWLEKVLFEKKHSARKDLVWCNLYYTTSNRKKVRIKTGFMAENSPFYLYPEIIDEVSKYIFVPKEIKKAYKNR